MFAAVPATPVKPNTPAISATTRKTNAQCNILLYLLLNENAWFCQLAVVQAGYRAEPASR
jgi:hypothetical protein